MDCVVSAEDSGYTPVLDDFVHWLGGNPLTDKEISEYLSKYEDPEDREYYREQLINFNNRFNS